MFWTNRNIVSEASLRSSFLKISALIACCFGHTYWKNSHQLHFHRLACGNYFQEEPFKRDRCPLSKHTFADAMILWPRYCSGVATATIYTPFIGNDKSRV